MYFDQVNRQIPENVAAALVDVLPEIFGEEAAHEALHAISTYLENLLAEESAAAKAAEAARDSLLAELAQTLPGNHEPLERDVYQWGVYGDGGTVYALPGGRAVFEIHTPGDKALPLAEAISRVFDPRSQPLTHPRPGNNKSRTSRIGLASDLRPHRDTVTVWQQAPSQQLPAPAHEDAFAHG